MKFKNKLTEVPGRRRFGFTLAELIVSSAVAALIGLFFAQTFRVTARFLAENDAKSSLKEAGDRLTAQLNGDLAAVVRVFGRRYVGPSFTDDYSSFVDLAGSPTPLFGSRLRANYTGMGDSDGNVLFIARELAPWDLTIGPLKRRIDRYVFVYYYVSLHGGERSFGGQPARHLYRWKSIEYANASQIYNIPIAERPALIMALKGKNVNFAYDPSQSFLDNAFFSLDGAGTISPLAGYHIQREEIVQATKNRGGRYLSGFSWSLDLSGFNVFSFNDKPNKIEVRVALIAQGAFPDFIRYETFSLCDLPRGN